MPEAGPADRWWRWIVRALCLALILSAARSWLWLNGDVAALVDSALRWQAGERPYLDFYDLNPPLTVAIVMVPAKLSLLLGANPYLFNQIWVALVAMVSVELVGLVLRRARPSWAAVEVACLQVAWLLFSAKAFRIREFGQREQLFMLAFAPYLLCRLRTWQGDSERLGLVLPLGFAAGLMALQKPYFVLVWVALECLCAATRRSWRPLLALEQAGLLLAVIVSAAVTFAMPRESVSNYLDWWLPFTIRGYDSYANPAWEVMAFSSTGGQLTAAALGVAALAVLLRPAEPRASWSLGQPLALGVLLAYVSCYWLQHKGWTYHTLPPLGFAYLLGGVLAANAPVAAVESRAAGGRWQVCFSTRVLRLVVTGLTAVGLLVQVASLGPEPQLRGQWPDLVRRYSRPGEPVMVLDTSISLNFPMLPMLHRRNACRYPHMLPIAFLYGGGPSAEPVHYRTPAEAGPDETRVVGHLIDDVERYRPCLIMTDDNGHCDALPPEFVMLDYLRAAGFLDHIDRDYVRLEGALEGVAVFVRRDLAGQ